MLVDAQILLAIPDHLDRTTRRFREKHGFRRMLAPGAPAEISPLKLVVDDHLCTIDPERLRSKPAVKGRRLRR